MYYSKEDPCCGVVKMTIFAKNNGVIVTILIVMMAPAFAVHVVRLIPELIEIFILIIS